MQVTKRFNTSNGEQLVLEDISLEVQEGECCAILGPSGCGKSTLLRIAAGIQDATYGSVFVEGLPLVGSPANVGMMTQEDTLYNWLSVQKNVEWPQRWSHARNRKDLNADDLIAMVGLSGSEYKYPHQLSKGQRQRVALARTLNCAPSILLLDEPFSSLDIVTKEIIQEELWQIIKKMSFTVVLVTHDPAEALFLADRIVLLSARPAKLVAEVKVGFGERNKLIRSRSDFVRAREELVDKIRWQIHS